MLSTLLAQADLDGSVNVAQNIGFGIIATVMIFAAFSVVTTKNVVHAALYLVLVLAGVGFAFAFNWTELSIEPNLILAIVLPAVLYPAAIETS